MSKWIDAEWLKQNFNTVFWSQITKTIDSAPSIDICFCHECKHHAYPIVRDRQKKFECFKHHIRVKADDFCSYGERNINE